MTRSTPTRQPSDQDAHARAAELETITHRLAALELTQIRLRNTVCGLARESGVSVGGVCARCDQSYVLIADGMLYCPKCRNRRTM